MIDRLYMEMTAYHNMFRTDAGREICRHAFGSF